uniref:Zinc finger, PMZ-type n=1 Tax=Tanacetum cinerariifolium TaxID=118510 RepID=A0A6L2LRG9_TANCI|nr:zinc finger, PMZ-type [Tanacetum cinerariifolium]
MNRDLIGVDHWYSQQRWFEPYQFSIRHVFGSTMCKRTDNPPLLPPIVRTMPGRHRKNKVKAQSENNSQRTSSKPPDYATYASVRGGGRVSRGGISGRGEGSGSIGQTSGGMGQSSDGRGQRVGGRGQRGGGKSQIGGGRGQRGGGYGWQKHLKLTGKTKTRIDWVSFAGMNTGLGRNILYFPDMGSVMGFDGGDYHHEGGACGSDEGGEYLSLKNGCIA